MSIIPGICVWTTTTSIQNRNCFHINRTAKNTQRHRNRKEISILFASDDQYQSFYQVHNGGSHGAGYNGEGLSADEYKASEASYGYQAYYSSYNIPNQISTSQQPSREATPSNDTFHREDQEQDQHAEHVEDNVQGDNRQGSSPNSKGRVSGESCVSFGSIVRSTCKVLNFTSLAVGLEEVMEIRLEIVKNVEDWDLKRLHRGLRTLKVHRIEFWVSHIYLLQWSHLLC
jgi:hypothetical protein